ncbi:MAG: heavy metal response regulator transcription factor [Gammaproteobacteria bacterium]|nr:heavy metal response regulator transcription factor [Gammaproteobacteria bacterium]
MKVLIIEDEIKIAEFLRKGLAASGFIPDVVHNGEDGLFHATEFDYQLILLDVMLPLRDGFSVLSALRKVNQSVHVILLTARDAVEDRVKGLELGADDYLVKPFSFAELLARIRSALRRSTQQKENKLTIADLSIDLKKHKAQRNQQRIDLTPKEFSLLTLLAQRKGEVLSRTLIAELVWDIHFDCDSNIVDVAIRRLRQKVDDPFEKKLIHTIRGMGYLLEERS